MALNKVAIVNYRSEQVRYLPNYELYLARALEERGAAREIVIYTLLPDEEPADYYDRWRDADLLLFWEYFSTKAPTYVQRYLDHAPQIRRELGVPVLFGGFWATSYARAYKEDFEVFDKVFVGHSVDRIVEELPKALEHPGHIIDVAGEMGIGDIPLNLDYLDAPEKHLSSKTLRGYMTSFSCPLNCVFCFANAARNQGSGFVARSLERVKEDIDLLADRLSWEKIDIKDLNFFANRERALSILEYLDAKGKKIGINLDIVLRSMNDKTMERLKRLDIADNLYFGLESFNPEIRKRIGKPFTDEHMEHAFALADKHGINITGNVILGLPWQSTEDLHDSVRKAIHYVNKYEHVFIAMNAYKPEFGTDLQKFHLTDIHEKLSFKELCDLYLNDVVDQDLIYGDQFKEIDIEQLHNGMRLINRAKKARMKARSGLHRWVLLRFQRYIEGHMRQPYFQSRVARRFANRPATTFIIGKLYPGKWKVIRGELGRALSQRLLRRRGSVALGTGA